MQAQLFRDAAITGLGSAKGFIQLDHRVRQSAAVDCTALAHYGKPMA